MCTSFLLKKQDKDLAAVTSSIAPWSENNISTEYQGCQHNLMYVVHLKLLGDPKSVRFVTATTKAICVHRSDSVAICCDEADVKVIHLWEGEGTVDTKGVRYRVQTAETTWKRQLLRAQ
jgi:hypothetical protein